MALHNSALSSLGKQMKQLQLKMRSPVSADSHRATERKSPMLVPPQVVGALASAALSVMLMAQPVQAADAAKVGTCLFAQCPGALERCIGDSDCLKSLVCLNQCADGPDETACQIRCGDLYSDDAISAFNACAVSEKK
eukprot:gene10128-8029_t